MTSKKNNDQLSQALKRNIQRRKQPIPTSDDQTSTASDHTAKSTSDNN